MLVPTTGSGQPESYLATRFSEMEGRFSLTENGSPTLRMSPGALRSTFVHSPMVTKGIKFPMTEGDDPTGVATGRRFFISMPKIMSLLRQ